MSHACANHDHCIEDALHAAEAICTVQNTRLTPTRRRVLELIWSSHKAHKAYDILDTLAKEDKAAKPPTVYRALDFLIEMKLIHKIESLNAYVGCHHPNECQTHQFLICEQCGTVEDIQDSKADDALNHLCAQHKFKQSSKIIEIKGVCDKC